jgi:hypothetical protein
MEMQRVRVLPARALSGESWHGPGEDIDLPFDEASQLAKDGIVAIVLAEGTYVSRPKPQEVAERPQSVWTTEGIGGQAA